MIAKNANISVEVAGKIYDHIYVNRHRLDSGNKRFAPDYDMAQSWQRLRTGKDIQKHDIIMLEHELFESLIEKNYKTLREAHNETEKIYNYQRALDKFKKMKGWEIDG